jgi:hypothetical protein
MPNLERFVDDPAAYLKPCGRYSTGSEIDDLGGELLESSGFENEAPEPDFEEGE